MKHIISNFEAGLSTSEKNAPENTYLEGTGIDLYRDIGYLKPGNTFSTITKSDDTPQIIDGAIQDICTNNLEAFFLSDTKIFKLKNIIGSTFDDDFDGGGNYGYTIPDAANAYKLILYDIGGDTYLMYSYRKGATDSYAGDVGTYNLSDTFNPDYLSTDVGTGAAALEGDIAMRGPIDMMEWKSYLYICHGQYVGRLDGANEVWDATKLDLGDGWEVTKLFPTQHYLGICVWKKYTTHVLGADYRTEARIFFWDGSSTDWSYWIPISDNRVDTAINNNGDVLLLTSGSDYSSTLARLGEFGSSALRKLRLKKKTGTVYHRDIPVNNIDIKGNRILFGSRRHVFSYGREEIGQPESFTCPNIGGSSGAITALKQVSYWDMFVCHTRAGSPDVHYISKLSGDSTASYRANYIDAGQLVQINYVKVYTKRLSSGDELEIELEINNNLDDLVELGTMSFTKDGAVTSKIFRHKHPICHSFRPAIYWKGGGVAISKIVIDYDYIQE
jgi:hypothetical protein